MSDTKALDLILKSERDRSNLQASDESFWSIEYLDLATAELAQLQIMLVSIEYENLKLMETNAHLRADLDMEHKTADAAQVRFENTKATLDKARKVIERIRLRVIGEMRPENNFQNTEIRLTVANECDVYLEAHPEEKMTNEEWKAAKEHVDQMDKAYAGLAFMPHVNVEFVRRMVIAPLQDRYDNGERSPELYAEMMALE